MICSQLPRNIFILTSFTELKLSKPIQRALANEQYTTPTPIQAQAIPYLLQGRDLLGCAQTGTGKTAAFALPILQRVSQDNSFAPAGAPCVLVLSPTRELACQINANFKTYGRFLKVRQTVIYGGVNQRPQVQALRRGVHIVVATPGRLLDLLNQGHIRLDKVHTLVLDEADQMLDQGFLPDIKRIIARVPKKRQSLLFSATLAGQIKELSKELLMDPVRVVITPPATTVDHIDQRICLVKRSDKRPLLGEMLGKPKTDRVLIFTRTKRGADNVSKQLRLDGIKTDAIHGNKSQAFRTRALQAFRSGRIRVLVATDVAARGIDIDGITHVINYDMPNEPESYVHRIGRTGRAGATGIAFSFCDHTEHGSLRAIERLIRKTIPIHKEHSYHSSTAPPTAGRRQKPFSGRGPSRWQAKRKRKPVRSSGRR